MKIILTGSAGFIGSHLEEALKKKGHDVFGIDKKIRAYPGQRPIDCSDGKQLADYIETFVQDPEMIIHLAGSCSTQKGIDHPDQDFKDNVLGSFNMVETAKYYGIPIIYASSCKVNPVDGIRTPYGLSKYVGEQYCMEYANLYGLDYIANRMGTIYGPGQEGSPESGWLAWFIKCKIDGHPLTVFGDGKQVRDVLYIDDLIKLYIDQVENFEDYANQTYDVGGGKENAIDLLTAIKALGIGVYQHGERRPGDADSFISDNVKISKVNKWKPKTKWDVGLKKTLEYYKNL